MGPTAQTAPVLTTLTLLTILIAPGGHAIRAVPGEPAMRYILHSVARDPPPGGWGVVYVLPGGQGGPDFAPFVARLADAAPPGTLVAQLVAAPITPADAADPWEMVWPIRTVADEHPQRQAFTVDEHLAAVRDDLAVGHDLDPDRQHVLAWSSGGPATYTLLLDDEPRSSTAA